MKPLFRSPHDQQTHSRSGIAFIVEMLILFVLVAACLTVLVEMFTAAHEQGEENSQTVNAVHLAANAAECFSADPTGVPSVEIVGDLEVKTTVTSEQQARGVLYHAQIGVYQVDEQGQASSDPCYQVETARYVKAGDA